MNKAFPFLHWLLTLVIAPFISQGLNALFGKDPHVIVTLLEFYPITIVISYIYSIPAFVVYFLCFLLIRKRKIPGLTAKLILTGITVAGILVTTTLTGGTLMNEVNAAYSVSAIIAGLLMPIRQSIIPSSESLIAGSGQESSNP